MTVLYETVQSLIISHFGMKEQNFSNGSRHGKKPLNRIHHLENGLLVERLMLRITH